MILGITSEKRMGVSEREGRNKSDMIRYMIQCPNTITSFPI